MENEALTQAIEKMGSQTALAKSIDVTPQAVSIWFAKGRVPAEYVVSIERATDGKIKRHELRPDLYEGMQPAPSPEPAE